MSDKTNESWGVYLVRTNQGTLYAGAAKNIEQRFAQHLEQGTKCAKYLRGKAPLSLVYTEIVGTRSEALKREAELKKLPKHKKELLIIESSNID